MDDRNDGFYHGYDETDWRERPDNTPDADEQARRKAEYEAKLEAAIVAEMAAAKGKTLCN